MADFDLSQDGLTGAVALRVLTPFDYVSFDLSSDGLPGAVALYTLVPFDFTTFDLSSDGLLDAVALYLNVLPWYLEPTVVTVYKMRGEDAVTSGLYDT